MNKHGQTLIEIIVSMLLLSFVATWLIAAFATIGAVPGKLTPLDQQGLFFAREIIEKLHNNVSADATASAPLNIGTYTNADGNTLTPLPSGDFRDNHAAVRTYTVAYVDEANHDLGEKVTVTVSWAD